MYCMYLMLSALGSHTAIRSVRVGGEEVSCVVELSCAVGVVKRALRLVG